MDENDREQINKWLTDIKRGSESSLVLLYQKVGSRLFSVALGITGDRQLAEDALQDSLIKIIKYAASFRRKDNGYGWLCAIVRNSALTLVKKFRSAVNIDELSNLVELSAKNRPDAEIAGVKIAISTLSKAEQALIYYKYVCDMTVREIAEEVCQPKSTVSYNILKAEEKLRNKLSD